MKGRILPGTTDKQQGLELAAILNDGGVAPDVAQHCQVTHNQPFDQGELAERITIQLERALCRSREGGA